MNKLNHIHDQIVEIVAQHLGISSEEIHDDATLDSLGMDSLDRVEVIMRIEEELDVEISDERADTLCSVSELVAYVDSLKNV